MNARAIPAGFQAIRRDQLRQEREHDAYKSRHKLSEPAACSDCGAVFHAGRWQWAPRPQGAEEVLCAACHRIRDHFPAGFVQVGGQFFAEHRGELMSLIRHHADKAKEQHPLARIMDIEPDGEGVLITTTDVHLARDLGVALHHACQGELELHYNPEEKLLRVYWQR